ncbi:DUF350 domain-containing protein [Gephyromycinifex aptenodytis]|uniref:DUF350 domain-containing protein n=1 Tax=Gephyromycinifex aptenodytis TaxID=2716227 RepID=UPI001445DB62|nr:DUF350 domain-containing protein [Gephyromycinifex aptenodytis]
MMTALGFGAAYSLLGLVLLIAGFYVLDLLTPGRLGERLTQGNSYNAGLMVGAGFIGLGAILATVIWHNAGSGFGPSLQWTLAFGVLGIVLQAVCFLVLDLFTPGSLSEIVVSDGLHPAGIAAAAAQIAISLIVCASIA